MMKTVSVCNNVYLEIVEKITTKKSTKTNKEKEDMEVHVVLPYQTIIVIILYYYHFQSQLMLFNILRNTI